MFSTRRSASHAPGSGSRSSRRSILSLTARPIATVASPSWRRISSPARTASCSLSAARSWRRSRSSSASSTATTTCRSWSRRSAPRPTVAADPTLLEPRRIADAFQRAPSLVDAILRGGPYASVDAVMRTARTLVDAMSARQRIALLNAHPRLGAAPATLSGSSAREQGLATDAGTMREMVRLNEEYEQRFGFRSVIFDAGGQHYALEALERARYARDLTTELRTGGDDYLAIARDRLESYTIPYRAD